ncbi:hypothetical protein IWW52_002704 [Coemansia sp. RSA 2704]|nr:hypothetical protein IWW52_002704 [Coemansia sp. RSA 2704]
MRTNCGRALDRLPFDILCRIFVLAQWPSLALASRAFLDVSRSMAVRARFCLAEFGRAHVLDSRLGLPARRPRMVRQDAVLMLLNLGADPRADAQWVLRHACAEAWLPAVRKLLAMRRHASRAPAGHAPLLDNWRGAGSPQPGADESAPLLVDVHHDDDAALRISAGLGRCAMVQLLLDAGADADAAGGEPLALAAGSCHVDAVQLLLARGASARASHSQALRAAVLAGDAAIGCVRALLAHGADARVMGDSCLLAACYKGDGQLPPPPPLREYSHAALLAYSCAAPAPAAAAPMPPPARRQPRRYRTAAGAHMDTPDPQAAGANIATHIGVVRLLLARGVDANAQGGRPLSYASAKGWARTAAVLLAYGADVHVRNDEPLREAAEHGHLCVVRLLVAAGADVHADDAAPLREAARGGHLDVVRELLVRGASAHGRCGVLALRAAARGGWVHVVQALVAAGADPADPEFRALAMRSRDIRSAMGFSYEPATNRLMF